MKIEFLPEALEYFNELSTILYEKKYFGSEESAIQYVSDLLHDIKTTLPYRIKKLAPKHFDRYGSKMLYSTFKKNHSTQWYVFFTVYNKENETIFLVRYISNNHVIAQFV